MRGHHQRLNSKRSAVFLQESPIEVKNEMFSTLNIYFLKWNELIHLLIYQYQPPPTRAKSPKLGRRKSFSDAKVYDGGVQEGRHSFHIFRDSPTNRKSGTHVKNAASWQSREQSHRGGEMDEAFTSSKLIGERCMDIAVHSWWAAVSYVPINGEKWVIL